MRWTWSERALPWPRKPRRLKLGVVGFVEVRRIPSPQCLFVHVHIHVFVFIYTYRDVYVYVYLAVVSLVPVIRPCIESYQPTEREKKGLEASEG